MATAIILPEGAPEEVITQSLVRDVDLTPFGFKGSLALITLDNGLDHTRPNTLGPQSLLALDAAITDAAARTPAAIAIIGKPFIFAAGADLSSVAGIGAGATARAVIAALAAHGARVTVVNRSPARLATAVAVGNSARAESTFAGVLLDVGACSTIVNTTPVGMADVSGTAPDALPFDVQVLTSHHTVLDAVYHPLNTPLVQAARARGANVVDGLDMLCAQARRQQQLWLGRLPDVALMRDAALAELAKRHG